MIRPVRLQLSRRKGFDLLAHSRAVNGLAAVKVDRSTRWGNPFVIGSLSNCGVKFVGGPLSRRDSLEMHRGYIDLMLRDYPKVLDPLVGLSLACWCGLNESCHADDLLDLARRPAGSKDPQAQSLGARP